jgi:alpha-tubulin suppressor-like RCC1 family protein
MSVTLITNTVIAASSIRPENLSFGAPKWSASGVLSATKFYGSGANLTGVATGDATQTVLSILSSTTFTGYITADSFVGDGSKLTNVFPSVSVVEVNDSFFQITPAHNNAVIALNSSSDINLDVDFIGDFTEGHKTTLVQINQGKGIIGFPAYNSSDFDRTKGLYSVSTLLYGGDFNGWTLYGDLTASVAPPLPPAPGLSGANFTQLVGGNHYSLALSGNKLFATGYNLYGQLGLGDTTNRSLFTRISNNNEWTDISSNRWSSFTLSGTDLYSCGYNEYGVLAVNDTNHRSTFTKVTVPTNAKWTAVKSGGFHALALSGTDLYVSGTGLYGVLGLGSSVDRSTFTKVTAPANAKWTSIAAGTNNSFALSGNDLYSCGLNNYGQLGLGDTVDRSTFTKILGNWTAIAAGDRSCFALSGTDLYVCGDNRFGQLGIGNTAHRSTFTKITTPINAKWSAVAVNYSHVFALSGNTIFAAGYNVFGGLGLGDTANRSTFTKISGTWTSASMGNFHSFALSGSSLYVAGRGTYGGLGLNDTLNRSTFTQVTAVSI